MSGTYNFTISKTGYTSEPGSITIACGDTTDTVTIPVNATSCGTTCSPCNIPNTNLTASWVNTAGNSSATLTYSATGPTWATTCNVIGTDSFTVTLACVGGNDQLTVVYYPGSTTCTPGGSTSTAATYAASCVDGGGGLNAWTNPGNGAASDGSYAVALLGGGSNYLTWTGFGFAIPSGATVLGIEFEVNGIDSNSFGTDNGVYLVIGGTRVGVNQATGAGFGSGGSTLTYGGPTSLWGLTPTAAQINASNFGVAWSGVGGHSVSSSVDYGRITVYYTGGSITYSSATGGGLTLSATCSPLDLVYTVDGSSALKTVYGFTSFTVTL
jgi:hypothetical protein